MARCRLQRHPAFPFQPLLAALIVDLTFLSKAGAGSRSGDMEHLYLADVYTEIGKPEEARREYLAAAQRPASVLKEVVQSRLAALDRGAVPTATS